MAKMFASVMSPGVRLFSSQVSKQYDAVVVGGGHNGLTAAAYLAKSGRSVCVLERKSSVGGAAITEEIVPGYKFSRCSYLLSLLRPVIMRELELQRHGLNLFRRDPSSFTPILDSRGLTKHLTLGQSPEENKKQIATFSSSDAARFAAYEAQLSRFSNLIEPLLDSSPADMHDFLRGHFAKKLHMLKVLRPLAKAARDTSLEDLAALCELVTAPISKVLDRWFESSVLKATLATDACIGAAVGPDTPGGGYVLLHHVMGSLDEGGEHGMWAYPEGGMGAVSDALAASAREAGADIVTGCQVEEIVVENGVTLGVHLKDGGGFIRAGQVLSNATPRTTFRQLMDERHFDKEFLDAEASVDYTSPVTKINVAVNKMPNFTAAPNDHEGAIMPHHRATIHLNCENLDVLREAFEDFKCGRVSAKPMIEMVIPSSLDRTLAPEGHHVCLFFTQFTPFSPSDGDYATGWDAATKNRYAGLIFDNVEAYAPGFKASVVGQPDVLTPVDLENEFGLTGGNIFHGSMSLDQLFFSRPNAAASEGPRLTHIKGLYLCGSGAHPGGGVMGAPGRLAARKAVEDVGRVWPFA